MELVTTRGGHGTIGNGVCVVQGPYDLQVNAVVKGPGHAAVRMQAVVKRYKRT
jgi:hypothetical protein